LVFFPAHLRDLLILLWVWREVEQVDDSQFVALASVWTIFLLIGLVAALGPSACAFSKACEDVVSTFIYHQRPAATSNFGLALNASITVAFGFAVGAPVTIAACELKFQILMFKFLISYVFLFGKGLLFLVQSLKGLWKGDLVALKGCCPNCAEEVYFIAV
jgi:hypothetical protein